MAYQCCMNVLLPFYLLSCVPFLSHAEINLPLRGVNLGNWLVTEGRMERSPSRFDGITNNDLLDGTQVQFKSIKLQRFLSAENGSGTNLVADRTSASDWETFRLWRINESTFNLRAFNKQFVGLENQGQERKIVAVSNSAGDSETFEIIRKSDDPYRVRIKDKNGLFLQAQSETLVTADYAGLGWEDANPSVFQLNIVKILQGEYQITNGYGPDRAPQVMREHWNTYITEEDFSFMSSSGLNAVRIPVGWWIRYDPTPPKPFVGGSLNALDNAFTWAQKYKMMVIVDLHAVEGSQNCFDHSATRDGYQEWGESNIQDTVAVIEFLAKRYANNPSLAAIELMNEPFEPGVTFDTLNKYYIAGYDAVRKYTSSAYVIISNRLGPHVDHKEFLSFASGRTGVAIDVHYYSFFLKEFKAKNVQQNIDYIYKNRASDISSLTIPNGARIFVGEWSCAWYVRGAEMEDYQRFSKAQVDVYERGTFGWAFWSYKQGENVGSDEPMPWSLKWMIKHGYLNLNGA